MAHHQADLAVARAAAMGERPRWFQLYWSRSNERGAKDVILNVLAELDLTMGLAGCRACKR